MSTRPPCARADDADEDDDARPDYGNAPELALAALLALMTRFPARPSPAIARAVVAHLRVVADDPRLGDLLAGTAAEQIEQWRHFAALGEREVSGATTRH